ncbi:hypothetical protein CEXT_42411 [Caerostris extrusa]|uniref:Uncharacterized protein n=1 Tax=Caerostris extrusa TaxID=172846 RepID=A0AAV4MAI3_CAEEX|nr:hypothetical protein CEXT_42411 [Caerostris extrusa]
MTNGNHQPEAAGLRDDLGGPVSSDSENKDTQDFLQHLGGGVPPMPEPDGTMDLRRKSPKSPRGRRRVFGHDLQCDPLMDNPMEMSRKQMMMPEERRNSTLPEFEITNGKTDPCEDVYPTDYAPRPPRYYSPSNRWNKMGPLEDGFMGMQPSKPYPDDCLSMPKPSKRGRKKETVRAGRYKEGQEAEEAVGEDERAAAAALNAYQANNGDVPMDMYNTDAMLSMREPSH